MSKTFKAGEANGIPYLLEILNMDNDLIPPNTYISQAEVKICVSIPLNHIVEWDNDILPTTFSVHDVHTRYEFYVKVPDIESLMKVFATIEFIVKSKLKVKHKTPAKVHPKDILELYKEIRSNTDGEYDLNVVLGKDKVKFDDTMYLNPNTGEDMELVVLARTYLRIKIETSIASVECDCFDLLSNIEILGDLNETMLVIVNKSQHIALSALDGFEDIKDGGDFTSVRYRIPDLGGVAKVDWMRDKIDNFVSATYALLDGLCTHKTEDLNSTEFTDSFLSLVGIGTKTAIELKSSTLNQKDVDTLSTIEITGVLSTSKKDGSVNVAMLALVLPVGLLDVDDINSPLAKYKVSGGLLKLYFDLSDIKPNELSNKAVEYITSVYDAVFPPEVGTQTVN